MGLTAMPPRVKWTAQLDHVREVSLLGTADFRFWRERLADEEFTPVNHEGRTSILVVSAAASFMGVRFQELSVSVSGSSAIVAAEAPSYFLVRAFNSNRFFAFCERQFFATPYEAADVSVVEQIPASVRVTQRRRELFHALMRRTDAVTSRTPSQVREESILVQIMLPSRPHRTGRQSKMFFARIGGTTHIYPFLAGEDQLAMQPNAEGDVFQTLLESDFLPAEWIVRGSATHAKSKTYDRSEVAE